MTANFSVTLDGSGNPVTASNPLPVDGTLAISNVIDVVVNSGSVSVSNFPGTQAVSGTVSILSSDTVAVAGTVVNAGGSVSISNSPTVVLSSTTVAVSNFPTTQAVSGTVGISGGTIAVAGTIPVSGTVNVTATETLAVAGTVSIGNTPSVVVNSGTVAISGTPSVNATPVTTSASNGDINTRIQSAASTNSTLLKSSAGNIYQYIIGNSGTTDAWFKVYNKASAPTVGTDTPFFTVYVPKGTSLSLATPNGIYGTAGLGYGITGGAADSDTTAVAANQVTGLISVK